MSITKSLLWQGLKDNKVIYLFGTMHLGYQRMEWNERKVLPLIAKSDVFYAEMALHNFPKNFHLNHLIPNGKSLEDYFSEKKYYKLQKILKKSFAVDINSLKHLQPLFIQHAIDVSISGDTSIAMDQYLWDFANANNKILRGLESHNTQLEILNRLSMEFQIKSLNQIGKKVSRYRKRINDLIQLYNEKDIQKLYQKAKKSLGENKKLMIYDRNLKMAKAIDAILETKVFLSVGIGHLGGDKGILALLKRNGWEIKPIS